MKMTVNDIRNALQNPVVLHNWVVTILKAPEGVTIPDNFTMRMSTIDLPVPKTEFKSLSLGGFTLPTQLAKVDYSGELSGKIYEDNDGTVLRTIDEISKILWKHDTNDVQGNSCPWKAKAEVKIDLLGGCDDEIIKTFVLTGTIITLESLPALGQELDAMEATVKFSYDFALLQ